MKHIFFISIFTSVFLCQSICFAQSQSLDLISDTTDIVPTSSKISTLNKKEDRTFVEHVLPSLMPENKSFVEESSFNKKNILQDAKSAFLQPVSYYVLNQDVKSVFADLSKIIKIPIIVTPSVKGKATSGKYQGTTEDLLEMVCKDLNLHWYFDGNALHITRASEAVTKVFGLTGFSYRELIEALDNIGVDYSRFPLKLDSERNILVVYGPPRFVAGVEAIADNITSFKVRSRPSVLRH
jgi:type II secretory pathway component GspD/PulD (secretin)